MRRQTQVRELPRAKGRLLCTIGLDDSLVACARNMVDIDVASLIVVHESLLDGIVTWHDRRVQLSVWIRS